MSHALGINLSEQFTQTDQTLIRRIAAGDEDALRELFAMHGTMMRAFALRLTRDEALADEAVQESLLATWQSAGRFRAESKVRTWLLGIVHHKAVNLLRMRADLSLDEETAELTVLPESLHGQIERNDSRRLMRAAIDSLPLEQRAVLDLFFYQGYRLEEIAEILACPPGTVKSRLFNARNSLKGILARAGMGLEDL